MAWLSFLCGTAAAASDDSARLERAAARMLSQGLSADALATLAPVAAENRDSARFQALLGAAQYMERHYLAAVDSLGRAVDLGQRDLRTVYFYCSALWENGELAAAEEACRSGIGELGPQLPLAHLLGRLLLWQARYDEAVTWLGRAAGQGAGSVDLMLDLAGALEGAGRTEEALTALQQAVSLAPAHYQVRYGLARLLSRMGERQAAEEQLAIYRRLLEEDQRRTLEEGRLEAQIDRSYELLRQGDAAAAGELLASLPATVEVLLARADAWQALGERAAAVDALEQAVAMEPARGDLRARLAAVRLAEDPPQ